MKIFYKDTFNWNKITNSLANLSYLITISVIIVSFYQHQTPFWVLPILTIILLLWVPVHLLLKRLILWVKLKKMNMLNFYTRMEVESLFTKDDNTLESSKYKCSFKFDYSFWNYKYMIKMENVKSSISHSKDVKITFINKNELELEFFYINSPYNIENKPITQAGFKGLCKMNFEKKDKIKLINYYYTSTTPERKSFLKNFKIIK